MFMAVKAGRGGGVVGWFKSAVVQVVGTGGGCGVRGRCGTGPLLSSESERSISVTGSKTKQRWAEV